VIRHFVVREVADGQMRLNAGTEHGPVTKRFVNFVDETIGLLLRFNKLDPGTRPTGAICRLIIDLERI
jgi:hypothetical protein